MKDNFTLRDEEFAHFATRVGQHLDATGMRYAIIGNTAVQAQILNMMCRKRELPILSLVENEKLEDYLRHTSNVDVAIRPKKGESENDLIRRLIELRTTLAGIEDEISPSQEHLLGYHIERDGTKRMTFKACVDGDCSGMVGARILVGHRDLDGFGQDFYDAMIDGAYHLKIPYSANSGVIELRAAQPKDLLLVKGVQARPKDDMDVGALARAMQLFGKDGFDLEKLQRIFGEDYKTEFARFAALTADYARHK